MLKIKAIMNSNCEEIFAKKCCNYPDQNLEIQLTNAGDAPLIIPSFCDFVRQDSDRGQEIMDRIDYLMPHGSIRLEPGQSASFYCYMDENRFKSYDKLILHDISENTYSFSLRNICS